MNQIDISTSQNVVINYEIASVGDRILAAIVDWIIKIGAVILVIYIISEVQFPSKYWWIFIIGLIPVMLYSFLFEWLMNGQTPGKRLLKIKVVNLDGSSATIGGYLIRWLLRIIDTNIFYGVVAIITIVINKKGQRVGDILAGTTVIKVKDRVSLRDTIYEKVNDTYQVMYPEAKKLEPAEVELIKKVLNTKEYKDNFDMVYNLTNKIQNKLGVMRKEGPEDFLRTVIKDYNNLVDV